MLNRTSLIFAFFTVVVLAYFHDALSGEEIFTERDLASFFIPSKISWVAAVKAGEFPLWNPYSYSGHPLFATLQPGVLYPPNLLFLLLPFDLAFNWVIITHFMLAASFTFLLIREVGGSRCASTAGALIFLLGGYLLSVHNVLSTLLTVTWAPLAILLFLRCLSMEGRARGVYAILTSAVMTVMFLGGGIETLFGLFIMLLFICLFPSIFPAVSISSGRRSNLLLLSASAAAFLLLSAVQIIPFIELSQLSTRNSGIEYEKATTWSFQVKDFIQFLLPDPFGYQSSLDKYWANPSWIKTVYIGAVPVILSTFYVLGERRRAIPLLALMALSIVLALGGSTPLYKVVFDWLPIFDKVRYPVKFIFIFILCMSVTAGLGLDALKKGMEDGRAEVLTAARVLFILATISALIFGAMNLFSDELTSYLAGAGIDHPYFNRASVNVYNTKRLLFFFIVPSLAVYLAVRKGLFAGRLPHIIVAIIFVDLFFAHWGYYNRTGSAEYHREGPVIEMLKKKDGLFRVFVTPKTRNDELSVTAEGDGETALDPEKYKLLGYNISHRLFTADGFHVTARREYDDLMEKVVYRRSSIDATNLLAMFNVRYVLSVPEISSKEFVLSKVIASAAKEGPGTERTPLKLYENINYLPRFYTVGNYRVMAGGDMAAHMMGKGFDPAGEVLLFERPEYGTDAGDGGAAPANTGPPGRVTVDEYKANSVTLDVEMDSPGLLVASESHYPGWKVYVDGVAGRVLKANVVYRAVPLKEGRHEVRFVYSPMSFKAGAAISSVTAVSIVGFFVINRRRRARHDNSG